jgi:eukaryotic-like serine/threonine-protein kinase
MQPGTRLGGYEILSPLGAGGMGEVYRARDANLARDVALKILPEAFTRDPERVARFRREAQLLAALNHPNIGAIYGFEQAGASQFLVLELVDGETLDVRLRARPGGLPFEEAIAIARQIAEALEAAHDKGIVHRDLKPSNIALTAQDQVKVLDFGLAKAFDSSSSIDGGRDVTHSPTLTFQATQVGVILGTAAYMSPEQAKGRVADKRSDVWAFGCVLYEMLTGTRAYQGEDVSDTLATVLKGQPDWNALRRAPPAIQGLVRRCLEKDRRQRIGDIAVVRYVLGDLHGAAVPETAAASTPAPTGWRTSAVVGALIATAVVASALGWSSRRPPAVNRPLARFSVPLSADQPLVPAALGRHALALSPDGARLAFVANNQLFIRAMDQLEAAAVRGAGDSPFEPVFSPDGQWIAYYSTGHLKRIPIAGGAPTTICEAQAPWGASWTGDRILFGEGPGGILEVSANGGVPRVLVAADTKTAEFLHGPQLLPDGEHVLFTVGSAGSVIDRWAGAQIAVQSLKTGARKILMHGGADGRYVPTGHIVYGREGILFANAVDLDRLELVGGPTAVVEGVGMAAGGLTGALQFAVSSAGSLAYLPAQAGALTSINWRDRKGVDLPLAAPPHSYETPRVSPDGSRIVVHASDQDNDLWIWDTKNDTMTRLTFDKGADSSPVWTRDGKRIIYASNRDGVPALYWKAADGTGQPEPLLPKALDSNGALVPNGMTPDGKALIYSIGVPSDVMLLPLEADPGARQPRPLVAQPQFNERGGDVSPDGKWLVYYSDESGIFQVYVRPFPAVESGRWQVSTDGGGLPTWNRNGRELFYVDPHAHLVSVAVEPGASFAFGKPSTVLDLSDTVAVLRNYDFVPDGTRAAVVKQARSRSVTQFVVVENWFEELRQRVPGGK